MSGPKFVRLNSDQPNLINSGQGAIGSAVGGDLSGTLSSPSVVGIGGIPIVGVPASTDLIQYNGTNWVYVLPGSLGFMANPMTNAADIIYGGTPSGGVAPPTRLGINGSNTVLHGGATAPAWGAVVEGDFGFTDILTANASTSKHGLLPKLNGSNTTFLNGTGAWSTPAGSGAVEILDEGSSLTAAVTSINFTGAGVTASASGDAVTVNVPGGGGGGGSFTSLTGWTNLGTLDTLNVTDFSGYCHMVKTLTGGQRMDGIYKAAPGSFPYTITMFIPAMLWASNYRTAGLILTEASPGKLFWFGPIYNGGFGTAPGTSADWGYTKWTNNTTRSAAVDTSIAASLFPPLYVRLVVTASNNVATYVSKEGMIWYLANSGVDTGLTIANYGLAIGTQGNSIMVEAIFDLPSVV